MKINGQEVDGLNEDVLVLPRANGNLIFKGRAVDSFDEFEAQCPVPMPPVVLTRKGKHDDTDDSAYKLMLITHQVKRMAWLTLKTLEPSNIEWDTVKMDDSNTWCLWVDDMSKILSPGEQKLILDFILQTNCLDERKVAAARADFLRGLVPEASN